MDESKVPTMLERLSIRIKGQTELLEATSLTYRLLRRSGIAELIEGIPKEPPPQSGAPVEFRIEEAIQYKERLIRDWKETTSEETLRQIDVLTGAKITDVESIDLIKDPELQLLRVLAVEKALFPDIDELIRMYSQKESFGKFQQVLCSNNLGVLYARKQLCLQALWEFKEAIRACFELSIRAKAPFYNVVLLFAHLQAHRLIFRPQYIGILDEIEQLLDQLANGADPSTFRAIRMTPSEGAWPDERIRSAYVKIARHGYEYPDKPSDDFYSSYYTYLIPDKDVLRSFGDQQVDIDTTGGIREYERGLQAVRERRYFESCQAFERATQFYPMLVDAKERILRARLDWRNDINRGNDKLVDEHNFDKCEKNIQYLPDSNLIRPNDNELIQSFQREKYNLIIGEADSLVTRADEILEEAHKFGGQGKDDETKAKTAEAHAKFAEAKLKYIDVLSKEDLDAPLRRNVSNKLKELMDRNGYR